MVLSSLSYFQELIEENYCNHGSASIFIFTSPTNRCVLRSVHHCEIVLMEDGLNLEWNCCRILHAWPLGWSRSSFHPRPRVRPRLLVCSVAWQMMASDLFISWWSRDYYLKYLSKSKCEPHWVRWWRGGGGVWSSFISKKIIFLWNITICDYYYFYKISWLRNT